IRKGGSMQQVTIYSSGESGSLRIPRMQTTLPATPEMRIRQKSLDMKITSTCLPLGGMIKATVPENLHIALVDPEPGVGYGWSGKRKDPRKTGF
ncbi:MAG: hypothetical protein Q7T80_04195, partial [Methanoregula sp.]|nr:hypothetical protein [Methanoregula sp.]